MFTCSLRNTCWQLVDVLVGDGVVDEPWGLVRMLGVLMATPSIDMVGVLLYCAALHRASTAAKPKTSPAGVEHWFRHHPNTRDL